MDPAGLERLLRRASRREPEALETLVDAYSPRVFGMLYRLTGSRETAEDLTQETFLRVVRTIADYEHTGRFESWLFRIAGNLARDHGRRIQRRGRPASLDGLDQEGESARADVPDNRRPDAGEALAAAELGEELNARLRELNEMDREIILLRHFSELSFQEIAELLGIPLGTALARAHRALKRLRSAMDKEE